MQITNSQSWKYPREPRINYLKRALETDTLPAMNILDVGGNAGNLLRDGIETNEIAPKNYTCMDVDQKVILEAAKEFPDATWIYRPVTTPVYSRNLDQKDADVELKSEAYDFILAYSVYTHDTVEAMHKDIEKMLSYLKPGGHFLFTYINPKVAKLGFLQKRIDEFGYGADPEEFDNIDSYTYFVNNDIVKKDIDLSKIKYIQYLILVVDNDWILEYVRNNFGYSAKTVWGGFADGTFYQDGILITKDK